MNAYGFSDVQWAEAKAEIKQILSARASVSETIYYSDLVANLHSIQLGAQDPRLSDLLGDVSIEEDRAGRGMLSVIVVHKNGDFRPGPGFYALAKRLGRDTSDSEECWTKELKNVYSKWSKKR